MKDRVGDEKLIIGVAVRDINDHRFYLLFGSLPLKMCAMSI